MKNSLLFLGLVKKSGHLLIGDDAVTDAALTKKARIIITASDAGEYTIKRAKNLSEGRDISHIILEEKKDELGLVAGRNAVAIAAITDMGMAAGFVQKLNSETDRYNELSALLTAKAERFARRKRTTGEKKLKTGKRRKNV